MVTGRWALYGGPMTETPTTENNEPTPTPLRRMRNGGIIAGVAKGLGARYAVNPNIFRVLFVVLALFWGLGVAVYLAMWVFIPRLEGEADEPRNRNRAPSSTSRRLQWSLLLAALIVVVEAALLYAGVRAHHLGPGLALLWAVFLVALAVVAIRTGPRALTLRRFLGFTVLAVLSVLILVIGVFVGYLNSTGVPLTGGNGDHEWQPTGLAQVQHQYRTEFGFESVDLHLVTFPKTGFVVNASTAVGQLTVLVPANAVVTLTTHVGAGVVLTSQSTDNLQGNATDFGAFNPIPTGVTTAVQQAAAPHLTVNATVGVGQIDIERG